MATEQEYVKIRATDPDGTTANITQLCRSITWSGDYRNAARTLSYSPVVSDVDTHLPRAPTELGGSVQFWRESDLLMDAFALERTRDSLGNTIDVTAYDRGLYLTRNSDFRRVEKQTAEAVTAAVCGKFGIPVGELAATGVPLTRNFLGVTVYKIIMTMYSLASDQTGNQIRFSKEEHGMAPKQSACVFNLRSRSGRTAREYDDAHISTVAADLIEMVAQALAANTATPGTYPTAEDGHVLLTWEQVQYFLLEDILASSSVASSKAAELGFGSWKDRDIGVEPTVTLDEMLSSAYLPALGGPATAFNAMCTAQMLQGLHFRRAVAGEGYAAKYDLDGYLTPTWGTVGSRVYWDMATSDLVLDSAGPFSGDILVMGPADVKIGSSGGSSGSSMARSVDWDDIQNKPDVALRSNVFPTEHLYFQGVVPDMESLPAMNLGEDVGKMWAVTSINRYYVWTGNGWVTAPYRAIFEHTKEDIDLLLKPDKENSQDTGE